MTDTNEGFLRTEDRLTSRQYAAIGRVTALWSEADAGLERVLDRLALIPSILGYILTDKINPNNRIEMIYALINVHRGKYRNKLVDDTLLAEIEDYLPSIGWIKSDRDFVAHTVWIKASETELSRHDITAAARSGQDFSTSFCDRVADIEKFGDEVEKAANLLWNLGSRLPVIDAALLGKLLQLEHDNRRSPSLQGTRLIPRKAFAHLRRGPVPKQLQEPVRRNKKTHRAVQAAKTRVGAKTQ